MLIIHEFQHGSEYNQTQNGLFHTEHTKVNRNAIDPEITEADKASRYFTPFPTSLNLQEKNPNCQFSVGKVNAILAAFTQVYIDIDITIARAIFTIKLLQNQPLLALTSRS